MRIENAVGAHGRHIVPRKKRLGVTGLLEGRAALERAFERGVTALVALHRRGGGPRGNGVHRGGVGSAGQHLRQRRGCRAQYSTQKLIKQKRILNADTRSLEHAAALDVAGLLDVVAVAEVLTVLGPDGLVPAVVSDAGAA